MWQDGINNDCDFTAFVEYIYIYQLKVFYKNGTGQLRGEVVWIFLMKSEKDFLKIPGLLDLEF